jgi:hypothetical protein
MSDWQREIRLQPHWGQCKDGKISIQQLARVVAAKLKAIRPFNDDELDAERDELVEEFEAFAADGDAYRDDFDDIMDRLYDWGDTRLDTKFIGGKKVCWIDTISNPAPPKSVSAV